MQTFIGFLLQFHGRNYSFGYRIISLFCGTIIFLAVLPALLIGLGMIAEQYVSIGLNRKAEYLLGGISLSFGSFFLIWTAICQWKIGNGTPALNAPTQRLIVTGSYRLCRNPIELGAVFYYLGLGIFWSGIVTGAVCFLLGITIGSLYHKFVEEKELEQRFGEDYKEYKRKTPFLFPKFKP